MRFACSALNDVVHAKDDPHESPDDSGDDNSTSPERGRSRLCALLTKKPPFRIPEWRPFPCSAMVSAHRDLKKQTLARRETVVVTDDLDGTEGAQPVTFAFDGTQYEIDLSEENADALHQALTPYIVAARKRAAEAAGHPAVTAPQAAAVQAAKAAQTSPLSERGPERTATRCRSVAASRRRCGTSTKQRSKDAPTQSRPSQMLKGGSAAS